MTLRYRLFDLRTGFAVDELTDQYSPQLLVEENADGGGSFYLPADSPSVETIMSSPHDDLFALAYIDGKSVGTGFFPQIVDESASGSQYKDPRKDVFFSGPGPTDMFRHMYFQDLDRVPYPNEASWVQADGNEIVFDAYTIANSTYSNLITINRKQWNPWTGTPSDRWPKPTYTNSLAAGDNTIGLEERYWVIEPKTGSPAEMTQWEGGTQKFFMQSTVPFQVWALFENHTRKELINVTQYTSNTTVHEFSLEKQTNYEQPTKLLVLTRDQTGGTRYHRFVIASNVELSAGATGVDVMAANYNRAISELTAYITRPDGSLTYPGFGPRYMLWLMLVRGYFPVVGSNSVGGLSSINWDGLRGKFMSGYSELALGDSNGDAGNGTRMTFPKTFHLRQVMDRIIEECGGRFEMWASVDPSTDRLQFTPTYYQKLTKSTIPLNGSRTPLAVNYGIDRMDAKYSGVRAGKRVTRQDGFNRPSIAVATAPYDNNNWRTTLIDSPGSMNNERDQIQMQYDQEQGRFTDVTIDLDTEKTLLPFTNFSVSWLIPVTGVRYQKTNLYSRVISISLESPPNKPDRVTLELENPTSLEMAERRGGNRA